MIPLSPASPEGYPAPFWLLEALKVFGFSLHATAMHLWYPGIPVGVILALLGGRHGRALAGRLGRAMPIIMALGINFGIIPLLFTQVLNYQFFYTAGVLIAWPWLAIIALLMVAYYAVYLHAESSRRALVLASGIVSAGSLVTIGFVFANMFTLMTNQPQWLAIFHRTEVAGAPTGLALNLADPILPPRWLMMFGLAITTTAAYTVLDAAVFARQADAQYRAWAGRFALGLYSVGVVWFAATGSWYIFGALSPRVREAVMARPLIEGLMVLTAVAPGVPWLLIIIWRRVQAPVLAALVAAAQFGVIGVNAISRQWVQNVELRRYVDLAETPVRPQWLGLAGFVIALIVGVALVAWITAKLWAAWAAEQTSPNT